jgi:hypothetical protein
MRKALIFLLLLVAAGGTTRAQAADACSALTATKTSTYGFRPSQLAPAQFAEKLKGADAFHEQVKAAGPAGVACLGNLIVAEKADTFFAFDAAQVLSVIDASGDSDSAIEAGLLRADFADASVPRYLDVALQLSHRARDIGKIAAHYLHAPAVDTVFPGTNDKLDRTTGTLLLYGSMSPDLVDSYLAQEVKAPEPYVRDAAAAVWVTNMTERSFAGIAAMGSLGTLTASGRPYIQGIMKWHAVSVTPPKFTREQVLARLQQFPNVGKMTPEEGKELDNSTYATLTVADLPALREARRRMVQSPTTSSFRGYFAVTRLLLNTINRLDAYKQYRVH